MAILVVSPVLLIVVMVMTTYRIFTDRMLFSPRNLMNRVAIASIPAFIGVLIRPDEQGFEPAVQGILAGMKISSGIVSISLIIIGVIMSVQIVNSEWWERKCKRIDPYIA